jgi:3-oxosteroid 1-dehydrogenase
VRATGLTEEDFDLTVDVLVAGSGAAAGAAAVTASIENAQVAVFEQAEAFGGTTALSGAGIWIPNNSLMREKGIEDPRPQALKFMASQSYPHLYDATSPTLGLPSDAYELIETYYDKASLAVDWLVAQGVTEFLIEEDAPDYYPEHPDNAAPFGRLLRQPEYFESAHLAGPALVQRLLEHAEKYGARVRTNHRVYTVLQNLDGECVGAEVHVGQSTILVRARRAIVFGTGGFLHNERFRRDYLTGPTFGGCAAAGSMGDFVRIGTDVGAQLSNMKSAWWKQIALEHVLESTHVQGGFWMPFGDSMIQVNRYGHRVVNEKLPYNDRTPVHFAWNGQEFQNLVLFQIYDDHVAKETSGLRFPTPMPGESVKYVVSGETIDELAGKIEARLRELRHMTGGLELHEDFAANLRASIDRFNDFARRGVDADFGRGTFSLRASWVGNTRPDTKGTMHPFDPRGPYHCMLVVAGALDTKGGPKINTQAQVLDGNDQPIPGLYGAGNCVASAAGPHGYWGPGCTVGNALTFGWIAGTNAAAEPVKQLS